jgi:hypothetical protein
MCRVRIPFGIEQSRQNLIDGVTSRFHKLMWSRVAFLHHPTGKLK